MTDIGKELRLRDKVMELNSDIWREIGAQCGSLKQSKASWKEIKKSLIQETMGRDSSLTFVCGHFPEFLLYTTLSL